MSPCPLVLVSNSLGTAGKNKTTKQNNKTTKQQQEQNNNNKTHTKQGKKLCAKQRPEANLEISARVAPCFGDKHGRNCWHGVTKVVHAGSMQCSTGL